MTENLVMGDRLSYAGADLFPWHFYEVHVLVAAALSSSEHT